MTKDNGRTRRPASRQPLQARPLCLGIKVFIKITGAQGGPFPTNLSRRSLSIPVSVSTWLLVQSITSELQDNERARQPALVLPVIRTVRLKNQHESLHLVSSSTALEQFSCKRHSTSQAKRLPPQSEPAANSSRVPRKVGGIASKCIVSSKNLHSFQSHLEDAQASSGTPRLRRTLIHHQGRRASCGTPRHRIFFFSIQDSRSQIRIMMQLTRTEPTDSTSPDGVRL